MGSVRYLQVDVAQDVLEDEEDRDDVHQDGDLLGLAPSHLDDGVADEAEADTVGDGIGEGHHGNDKEGGASLLEVAPVDAGRALEHQHAHDLRTVVAALFGDFEELIHSFLSFCKLAGRKLPPLCGSHTLHERGQKKAPIRAPLPGFVEYNVFP